MATRSGEKMDSVLEWILDEDGEEAKSASVEKSATETSSNSKIGKLMRWMGSAVKRKPSSPDTAAASPGTISSSSGFSPAPVTLTPATTPATSQTTLTNNKKTTFAPSSNNSVGGGSAVNTSGQNYNYNQNHNQNQSQDQNLNTGVNNGSSSGSGSDITQTEKYNIVPPKKKTSSSIHSSASIASSAASSSAPRRKKSTRKKLNNEAMETIEIGDQGERAPLLNKHGQLEYTELNTSATKREEDEAKVVMLPWYSYWHPVDNIYDLFIKSTSSTIDISFTTPQDRLHLQCVDTFKIVALMWLLTVNMKTIMGEMVSGFSAWVEAREGFLQLIANDNNCFQPFTVALVLLGYYMAKTSLAPADYDVRKLAEGTGTGTGGGQHTSRSSLSTSGTQALADYYRWSRTFERIRDYFYLSWWAVFPALVAAIVTALIYGGTSNNTTIKCLYYSSCSRNWWTNLFLVTNFTPFFSEDGGSSTCSGDDNNDESGTVGDGAFCFPTLWAVSCAAQLAVSFVPVLVMYAIKSRYGHIATAAWTAMTLIVRYIVCQRITSELDYAMYIEYVPWARGDAIALGAMVFMYQNLGAPRPGDHLRSPHIQNSSSSSAAANSMRSPPRTTTATEQSITKESFESPTKTPRSRLFTAGTSFMSPYSPLPASRAQQQQQQALSPFKFYYGPDGRASSSPASPNFRGLASIEEGSPAGAADEAPPCTTILTHTLLKILELSIAALIFTVCLYITATDEPHWFSSYANEWQYRNVKLLAVAVMTQAAMVFFMDGTVLWPLSTLFTLPFLHPLASLAYPAFLTQTFAIYLFCQSIGSTDNSSSSSSAFTWEGSMNDYTVIYFELLFANVVLALGLALLVERPIYRLIKDRYAASY